MIKSNSKSKGLTLVEVVIAGAILGIVISLGFMVYFFITRSFDTGVVQTQIQQQARIIDEYLKKELRNTERIVLAGEGQEEVFDGSFKIKNNIFYKGDTSVTEGVITDIRVSISTEFELPLLIYEVTGFEEGQEYLFANQVLLNNNPQFFLNDTLVDTFDESLNLDEEGYVLYFVSGVEAAINERNYNLTISIEGQGTTTPSPGTYSYEENTLVELDAEAEDGWEFEKWVINDVNHGNPLPYILTLDENKTVIAYFTNGEEDIDNEDENGESLEDILKEIESLAFAEGSSGEADEPVIVVPTWEGVEFEFTGKTTGNHVDIIISTDNQEAEIIRHQQHSQEGTITLSATKDGHTEEKVFEVVIPSRNSGDPVTISEE